MPEGNGKPPVDDHQAALAIQEQPRTPAPGAMEPLDALALRVSLQDRLATLERHYGDLNTAFGQLRAYALNLGRQDDYTKLTMERNVRAAAADLAVKSLPEDTRGDSALLTTVAGAWLVWLKGGDQS